jgi:hypothetical protein
MALGPCGASGRSASGRGTLGRREVGLTKACAGAQTPRRRYGVRAGAPARWSVGGVTGAGAARSAQRVGVPPFDRVFLKNFE